MKTEQEAYKLLSKKIKLFPETLIVLGSGWNKLLEDIVVEKRMSYAELFDIKTSVPGHAGELIIGTVQNKRIACMSGRFHMYEGYTAREATMPIRLFAKMGIKKLILTAASGALNEKYKVGDFVILSDIITLLLALDSPLIGPQFIDVSEVFDIDMRKKAEKICVENAIPYQSGKYVYYHGPNFETPADKMALRILGADVCGMSTVPETLAARALNIQVLGLALVTNLAFVKHNHLEVLAEANKASSQMKTLLASLL